MRTHGAAWEWARCAGAVVFSDTGHAVRCTGGSAAVQARRRGTGTVNHRDRTRTTRMISLAPFSLRRTRTYIVRDGAGSTAHVLGGGNTRGRREVDEELHHDGVCAGVQMWMAGDASPSDRRQAGRRDPHDVPFPPGMSRPRAKTKQKGDLSFKSRKAEQIKIARGALVEIKAASTAPQVFGLTLDPPPTFDGARRQDGKASGSVRACACVSGPGPARRGVRDPDGVVRLRWRRRRRRRRRRR